MTIRPDQNQWRLFLEIQHRQMIALEKLADAVQQLVPVSTAAPNYQYQLENFNTFDWSCIGVTVERSDQFGAAIVSWRGLQFVRRSPQNKFGEAIWFSRCTGKDESNGENKYERLVTFRSLSKVEVEPVPQKVARMYNGSSDF